MDHNKNKRSGDIKLIKASRPVPSTNNELDEKNVDLMTPTTPKQTEQPQQKEKKRHRVSLRNIFIVTAIIIITFGISLASSQVLALFAQNKNNKNQADTPIDTSNASTNSLAVTDNPDTLPFNPEIITDPTAIYLPIEKIDVPDPLSQRKAFLKTYLDSKHSLLADHVDALSEQTQWKLIIAIADAESSYCKHKALNNCWGIGGAWNLKAYDNYDQAISDVNRILEQHYISAGLNSPKTIEHKWVGHANNNWELAAENVMDELKDVQ